jgi:pilin isopeptide linkage protein
MVDPPVQKTVSGEPPANSEFTFQLKAGNPLNPMPAGSVNDIKTITITGAGQADFGAWAYTKEGTYYYTVSEVNGKVSGYTYDTTVYTFTDTVKAVDGQLAVTRVITNGAGKPVTNFLTFINTYKASSSGGGGGEGGTGTGTGTGTNGPKTGDDSQATLYRVLLYMAGAVALGSAAYLLLSGRQSRRTAR